MLHVIGKKHCMRVMLQGLLKCKDTIQCHYMNTCHISGNVRKKFSSIWMTCQLQHLHSHQIFAFTSVNTYPGLWARSSPDCAILYNAIIAAQSVYPCVLFRSRLSVNRLFSNHCASDQHKIVTTQNTRYTYCRANKRQLDFDEEDDLKQLLENARKLLDTNNFKLDKINNAEDKVEYLVKHLCLCQCSPDNVFHFLRTNPGILQPSSSSLQKIVSFLEEIGLRRGQLLKALDRHQSLWKSDIGTLRKHLKLLQKLRLGDFRKIIARWPQILTIPSRQMTQIIEELRKCDFSAEEIKTIIADHPQVLKDTPQDIGLKLQYVHFCMGITDGKDLVHGKIFKFSLDHIRTRHVLLERMGIFRTPDKHKVRSSKNPSLRMILDSSDRKFCSKVAFISEEDLHIFRENLKDEFGLGSPSYVNDTDDDDGYAENDDTDEYSDSDEDKQK